MDWLMKFLTENMSVLVVVVPAAWVAVTYVLKLLSSAYDKKITREDKIRDGVPGLLNDSLSSMRTLLEQQDVFYKEILTSYKSELALSKMEIVKLQELIRKLEDEIAEIKNDCMNQPLSGETK